MLYRMVPRLLKWAAEEIDEILATVPDYDIALLAEEYDCSTKSIYERRRKLRQREAIGVDDRLPLGP